MKTAIVIVTILLCINTAYSAEKPDYNYPVTGWTKEELERETLKCVSKRLSEMRTESATMMLEKLCYYDTIAKGIKECLKP